MLRFIRIARLAVIDALEVEFDPGFNVLTGETGAGKSILVEAVSLLLGGRASGDLVRTGEDGATVEAIFQRGEEEIVIRREITAVGRSRAFINGVLVPAAALKDLAGDLIELHGQHEHQVLLESSTHLTALDAFGGLDADVERTRRSYAVWRAKVSECADLRTATADQLARQDFAAFQLAEIDKTAPTAAEDETLTATRQVLANAARVERLCEESYAAVYESEGAVLERLSGVWKRLVDLAALDPAFEPFLAARDGIKQHLEDLATFLRRYADAVDVSPSRLQVIEERLSALERLKRKHGPTLNDVLAHREQLAGEVKAIESSETRLKDLETELNALRGQYLVAARGLSARRHEVAREFGPRLLELLKDLALEHTRFEVRFHEGTPTDDAWSPHGIDRAEFFISTNPGEELRPLARIVSGGELSRIMLALKTITFHAKLAAAQSNGAGRSPGMVPPGMIFDEVDAGIGGRVADMVGRRLRGLGSAFQVLCITHLPQVAAHADTHFLIQKEVAGDRTTSGVTRLAPDQRVEELARMLAGHGVSDAARASARELLSRGQQRPVDSRAKGEPKPKGESETGRAKARKDRRGA